MSDLSERGYEVGSELSHIDERGHAAMVDVTAKLHTHRRAEVRGRVAHVGDVGAFDDGGSILLATARAAGLSAAKKTSSLIPLCHPLPLTSLSVEFAIGDDQVEIYCVAETIGQTGVEMEALVGCTFAALSIVYDLGDTAPRSSIEDLAVWEKSGGRSGHWLRRELDDADEG